MSTSLADDLVLEGEDDYVAAHTVLAIAREHDADAPVPAALLALRTLLDAGLARLGDLTRTAFVPWEATTDQACARAGELLVQQAADLGNAFWLDLTDAGAERAAALAGEVGPPTA